MKILNILKSPPDASTKRIIEVHSASNEVTTIDLTAGSVSYDKLVEDIFSYDKVICW
jgi:hypothetical protein